MVENHNGHISIINFINGKNDHLYNIFSLFISQLNFITFLYLLINNWTYIKRNAVYNATSSFSNVKLFYYFSEYLLRIS